MNYKAISIHDLYENTLGLYVVIDDSPDSDQVLLVPISFAHRRVVNRSDLEKG